MGRIIETHVAVAIVTMVTVNVGAGTNIPGRHMVGWIIYIYKVGQKSDTSRTLHYIVREVSLFWPTL